MTKYWLIIQCYICCCFIHRNWNDWIRTIIRNAGARSKVGGNAFRQSKSAIFFNLIFNLASNNCESKHAPTSKRGWFFLTQKIRCSSTNSYLYRVCHWLITLHQISRWLFSSHFWSLLKRECHFFEAAGALAKMGSSLKPNHRNHVKPSKFSFSKSLTHSVSHFSGFLVVQIVHCMPCIWWQYSRSPVWHLGSISTTSKRAICALNFRVSLNLHPKYATYEKQILKT